MTTISKRPPTLGVASKALTTDYADFVTPAIGVRQLRQLAVYLNHTNSTSTDVRLKMQASLDGSTPWFDVSGDEGDGTIATAIATLDDGDDFTRVVSFDVSPYAWVRFACIRTGGSASDTAELHYSGGD